MIPKRNNNISWDDYFMGVAMLSSYRSKDPNSQIGAVIVSPKNLILSMGYNGLPNNLSDDNISWERDSKFSYDTKYPYIIHAEQNAILNSQSNEFQNCRVYVTLFPCSTCAKLLIQTGIKEIIYMDDKYKNTDDDIASKRLLKQLDIKTRQFSSNVKITY